MSKKLSLFLFPLSSVPFSNKCKFIIIYYCHHTLASFSLRARTVSLSLYLALYIYMKFTPSLLVATVSLMRNAKCWRRRRRRRLPLAPLSLARWQPPPGLSSWAVLCWRNRQWQYQWNVCARKVAGKVVAYDTSCSVCVTHASCL